MIASVEDVTLLSLIHYQAQGNQADDHWNDILGLLKVQAPTLDLAYLDQQATRMDLEALFSQALIDAGIRDQTPSPSLQYAAITSLMNFPSNSAHYGKQKEGSCRP